MGPLFLKEKMKIILFKFFIIRHTHDSNRYKGIREASKILCEILTPWTDKNLVDYLFGKLYFLFSEDLIVYLQSQ